ncbi:MAG: hypothetical protein QME90_13250 [Thermodesulfobacteriota bacterium]|nr:hypothetical protein [Thermodesulfobacteriota bacterium]
MGTAQQLKKRRRQAIRLLKAGKNLSAAARALSSSGRKVIILDVKELSGFALIGIAAILILNAIIGYFQEPKAEASVRALKSMVVPKAKVVRGGL